MKKRLLILLILYSPFSFSDDFDCKYAANTMQINFCAGKELAIAEKEMNHYFLKSKAQQSHDPELITAMNKSQDAWLTYLTAHCDSIYTMWRDGTIRGVMELSCKTKLTKQRTHALWMNYLTYMDSTPPVLPEPK